MKQTLKYLFLLLIISLSGNCSDDKPDLGGDKRVATELGKDANYSLFAAALATLNITDDNYTVFALPDSIIKIDDDAMPAADMQWHVIRGKYTAKQLLQAHTLTTVGGQSLQVESETAEIGNETKTLLYINNIPVDYRNGRLLGEIEVYPIGANIAKISNVPNPADTQATNSWVALAMEGVWQIQPIIHRLYDMWSDGSHTLFDEYSDDTHKNCMEIFRRNNTHAARGMAGTYESRHVCGETLRYNTSRNAVHRNSGWWSATAGGVGFYLEQYSGLKWQQWDGFYFDGKTVKTTVTYTSGLGDEHYYGGEELVVVGTYYETVYSWKKIASAERF